MKLKRYLTEKVIFLRLENIIGNRPVILESETIFDRKVIFLGRES
jgi:hypothetical protein